MAKLMPPLLTHFDDDNGKPLSGGRVFFYEAGTNTPKDTYTDANSNIPNTNPVVLNARGDASVWLKAGEPYKAVICRPDLTVVRTVDNITRDAADETAAVIAEAVEVAKAETLAARDVATLQAGVATSQAAQAATSAGRAESEADRAEVARDAAELTAGIFPDVAAGLAATADGDFFSVPSSSDEEFLILYKNNSSVAEEIKVYPSAAALGSIKNGAYNKAFAVVDENNNEILSISRDGEFRTPVTDVLSKVAVSKTGDTETKAFAIKRVTGVNMAFAVADEAGRFLFGVNRAGQLVADFSLVPSAEKKTRGVYDYSVNHIFTYGQSLSVGQAMPIQTPSQKYDNLMFYRGQRPQYDYVAESAAEWYASLVPAVEIASPNPAWAGVLGETPSGGTGDMIKERILIEDGKHFTDHEYQILLSAPGYGAQTIAALSKGGEHYSRMLEQASHGLMLSNAQGKSYAVQAVTWTQGENDYASSTTRAVYAARMNQLVSDIQEDMKAVTGQQKEIVLISYQVASHIYYASDDYPDIALAQLDVEESNPLVYIATAMYQFDYTSGGHITGQSSKWLGAYYGLAYKRIVIDRVGWAPVKPISTVRQAKFVDIRFNVPCGNLVFDTAQVPAEENFGFSLVDASDAALTISGVEIIDSDRVRIKSASAIPAGSKVRYGFSGNATIGRGNLRDSQGDSIVFDRHGLNKRMDNWCLIFERSI